MSLIDDTIATLTAQVVAEYQAGGFEPDGVALALGRGAPDDVTQLGWGTDLRCRTDLTANADEIDSNSPEAVAQDLLHRLSTPHGGLINDPELLVAVGEDPDYGYPLGLLLSVGITPVEIAMHQDMAAAECRKDDRVSKATFTIEQDGAPDEFRVSLDCELKTGETFKLIMRATSGVALVEAEQRA